MEKPKLSFKGIRINTMTGIVLFATALISIALLFAAKMVSESALQLQHNTEIYIASQSAAADFLSASDYLTSCARSFVVTGEYEDAQRYFNESENQKRREKAFEKLESTRNESELKKMQTAMTYSKVLEEKELYAIKLVCIARNFDMDSLSPSLAEVHINPSDSSLSPTYMLVRARDKIYDSQYQQMKEYINSNVNEFLSTILKETQERQQQCIEEFNGYQTLQNSLIAALVVMVGIALLLIALWIVSPLQKGIENIQAQEKMPVRGAREFRMFAASYNSIFDSNRIRQEELVYKANHDSLTGINNREIFEEYYHNVKSSEEMVLLIIDIDYFKQINDVYGHQTGDHILIKTASLLQSSFRSGDRICRIGGDEFVVILLHAGLTNRSLLREKIALISDRLSHPSESDLPAVTISVGAAFGGRDVPVKALYKQADSALYTIKNKDRNGIAFFDELDTDLAEAKPDEE